MTATPQIPEPLVEMVPDGEPVAAEVVDTLPTMEWRGRTFAVRPDMSLLPMMQFAIIAKQHRTQPIPAGDTAAQGQRTMEQLAALWELLQQCVDPSSWDAFYEHGLTIGAQQAELMEAVQLAAAARAAHPTQPPSGSPAGRLTTAPSSAGTSSAQDWSGPIRQGDPRVQRRLEQEGRPDLALVVKRAREASTTSSPG